MSCIPAVFLIVYIFTTKRILEALFLASIVGLILVNPADILWNLSGSMTEVMMDEDTGWLIIVCGLMGSIMTLIERAGGASLRSYPYFDMGCICRQNTGIVGLGA